jgi:hypothetical protein
MPDGVLFPDSGPPFWFFLLGAGPLLLLGAVWVFVGAILVMKGDDVDKPNRVAQLYGYTVCLIALIVSLVSLSSILGAVFERANPLQSEGGFGTVLTSFESYKATYRREQQMFDRGGATRPDTASDVTLRQRYDALVANQISSTRYRTSKALTTSVMFLLIALGLFVAHWRWVRRINGTGQAAA